MKKNKQHEPIEAMIHIYMELSQGNSLYSFFMSNTEKCNFLLLFFVLLQNWITGGQNISFPGGVGGWFSGWGKVVDKEGRRLNVVQKLCTHECKCKNDYGSDYSRNGGRIGKRRLVEGVNSNMIYLIHCKNSYKCHNVAPPSITIKNYLNLILHIEYTLLYREVANEKNVYFPALG
jgi:hypothetical protein